MEAVEALDAELDAKAARDAAAAAAAAAAATAAAVATAAVVQAEGSTAAGPVVDAVGAAGTTVDLTSPRGVDSETVLPPLVSSTSSTSSSPATVSASSVDLPQDPVLRSLRLGRGLLTADSPAVSEPLTSDLFAVHAHARVLYIGDHLHSDVLACKRHMNWTTVSVVEELQTSLAGRPYGRASTTPSVNATATATAAAAAAVAAAEGRDGEVVDGVRQASRRGEAYLLVGGTETDAASVNDDDSDSDSDSDEDEDEDEGDEEEGDEEDEDDDREEKEKDDASEGQGGRARAVLVDEKGQGDRGSVGSRTSRRSRSSRAGTPTQGAGLRRDSLAALNQPPVLMDGEGATSGSSAASAAELSAGTEDGDAASEAGTQDTKESLLGDFWTSFLSFMDEAAATFGLPPLDSSDDESETDSAKKGGRGSASSVRSHGSRTSTGRNGATTPSSSSALSSSPQNLAASGSAAEGSGRGSGGGVGGRGGAGSSKHRRASQNPGGAGGGGSTHPPAFTVHAEPLDAETVADVGLPGGERVWGDFFTAGPNVSWFGRVVQRWSSWAVSDASMLDATV